MILGIRDLGFAPGAIDVARLVIGHAVDVLDVGVVPVRKIR